MARNGLNDLRDHLFMTLEDLRDKDNPMDLDRAKAVAEVAGVLIESAKVEVQAIRALDQAGADPKPSKFLAAGNEPGLRAVE